MGTFHDAIAGKEKISVIAEIKRRSPSHGDFPQHAVTELMAAYEKGGAAAISVVTEPTLFKGSIELLREVRKTTRLPILQKDFIASAEQVRETAEAGANAVLLIARLLDKKMLASLVSVAEKANLDPIIEIHDDADLQKISGIQNIIVGINNRNLATFETNVRHAEQFLKKINPSLPIIVESAFQTPAELAPYRGKIDAVLIGTTFLISQNPCKTLTTFTHARRTAK